MLTISKNIIKRVQSLAQRKARRQEGLFVAEGNKLVGDNLASMRCMELFATQSWWDANGHLLQGMTGSRTSGHEPLQYLVTETEMQRLSLMQAPQEVLGVFAIPQYELDAETLTNELTVVLDEVQDPGNVGTIIRLCDWFGIRNIVCSPTTADCFAPKVVQATMGAIARVKVHYTPLEAFLDDMRKRGLPIYGTYLEGENIYQTQLTQQGLIIMGNEGKGINPALKPYVDHKLNIPSYPVGMPTSESLNVGIATAITVAEFRRRTQA